MRIFAIIVGLFVSLPAAAQTAEERLAALNTYMQRGFAALEIDWASSAASQSSRIASATEVSTSVKRALTPDLQASMLYPPLASNLVRLDEAIADARIANACAFARQQVADALAKRDEDVARRALEGMTATLKNLQSTKRMPTAVERFSADRKALEANIVLLAKALDRERTERARAEVDAKLKSEAEVRQRARIEAEQRLKLQADEKSRLAAEAKAKPSIAALSKGGDMKQDVTGLARMRPSARSSRMFSAPSTAAVRSAISASAASMVINFFATSCPPQPQPDRATGCRIVIAPPPH